MKNYDEFEDFEELVWDLQKEGQLQERKNIAKHLKTFNMFTDDCIAEMVGLEVNTVVELKPKELMDLKKLKEW